MGRTYDDFESYMKERPDLPVTQMDSVEGTKGGKVLLTIHFVKAELMLSFLRDSNDSQSVIDVFDKVSTGTSGHNAAYPRQKLLPF